MTADPNTVYVCCTDATGIPIGGHYEDCLGAPPVPAGDERERLAALLHDAVGRTHSWPYLTRAVCPGAKGHMDIADRLLAAGVHLTEGSTQ